MQFFPPSIVIESERYHLGCANPAVIRTLTKQCNTMATNSSR